MLEQKGTTNICGFDADTIMVRGKDLCEDLIGKVSFTQMIYLQALGQEPTEAQCKIMDAVLVTIMEHGLVPSAIATRLTYYGAPESFTGAIAAGLLGVGDRYAGTASECGAVLERIVAAPDQEAAVSAEIQHYRSIGRPLPGFGHPIHGDLDPRVKRLISVAELQEVGGKYIRAVKLLEQGLQSTLKKNLVTNVSAAIGAVLAEAGVPSKMMRGVILTARCAGLVGHLFEEMNNPAGHQLWIGAQEAVDYQAS
jgi:citrate synthase